ncbi:hypothetical protein MFIFM68171_02094 [Madurella fahalii]|uniref:Uncharacterized protein n=1 Tax=Madurella fahalii TaxID=1157608 RepID=A0ABQ0G2B3_9PEZI
MSQGAFRIGLEAMYKALTGVDLERATYTYADEVLASWMEVLHGEDRLPENVYMIGDNPASDTVGGNIFSLILDQLLAEFLEVDESLLERVYRIFHFF